MVLKPDTANKTKNSYAGNTYSCLRAFYSNMFITPFSASEGDFLLLTSTNSAATETSGENVKPYFFSNNLFSNQLLVILIGVGRKEYSVNRLNPLNSTYESNTGSWDQFTTYNVILFIHIVRY